MKIGSFLILILFGFGCQNVPSLKQPSVRFYKSGHFLIKESFDSLGKIETKQSFNDDTLADGAEITYYPNGKIEKWKWYDTTDKYAYCAVYYNANGSFDSFAGNPFLSCVYGSDHTLELQMVNPPDVSTSLGYKDFQNDICVDSICFDPEPTDSTAWVVIPNHHFKKHHKYFIYFYFLNANGYIVQETRKEVVQYL